MKNIIFIAAPAAGKGTQSELLTKKYGYIHISTGDLLREEVKKGTELGKEIDSLMKSGSLVSTEIVTELLKKAILTADGPFILDGYPRNLEQIDILDKILKETKKEIGVVINLDVPYELLVQRATGRLSCPVCSRTYHKYFLKPINEGLCDDCNTELISRSDDTEETFKVRYQNYLDSTSPLIDYYKSKGLLVVVGSADTDATFEEIEKVIK